MTEEKTPMNVMIPPHISDSVVLGDVHQNMGAECPSCSASNVKVMKCQENKCTSIRFCELCHTNCKYSGESVLRFDSGEGSGPFCSECLEAQMERERIKLERRKAELERLEKERRVKERIELERLEKEKPLTKKEEEYRQEIMEIFVKSLTAAITEIDADPIVYLRTAMDKIIKSYGMMVDKESRSKILCYLTRDLIYLKNPDF